MNSKDRAICSGWISEGEAPLFSRLAYPSSLDHPECVFDGNEAARNELRDILLSGQIQPMANPPFLLHYDDQDIVISQVDRYNLPLRTVLSSHTGLMRTDPYYPPHFLREFYANHYRDIYRGKTHSSTQFMAEQITHGDRIFKRTKQHLPERKLNVLDIGCGMGGTLMAFRAQGHHTLGCDYGEEYGQEGRKAGLDIRIGGLETVANDGPFDLIICSHVLEHSIDPIGFAQSAAGLLKTDGILYIEVPGIMYIEKYWSGDVLRYLQNAHAWHFTAKTLAAMLSRARLEVMQSDESVWCVAKRNIRMDILPAADGSRVLNELYRLESTRTGSRIAA